MSCPGDGSHARWTWHGELAGRSIARPSIYWPGVSAGPLATTSHSSCHHRPRHAHRGLDCTPERTTVVVGSQSTKETAWSGTRAWPLTACNQLDLLKPLVLTNWRLQNSFFHKLVPFLNQSININSQISPHQSLLFLLNW